MPQTEPSGSHRDGSRAFWRYSGHIEDVDLQLLRGAYQIEGVRVVKTGGKQPVPFFSASLVDLSVQWGALLDGAIVAEIDLRSPKINFVTASSKPKREQKQEEQVEPSDNWTEVVQDLVPFSINRFSIAGGEVHYRDFESELNPYLRAYANVDVERGTFAVDAEYRCSHPLQGPPRAARGRRLVRDGQLAAQRLHRSVASRPRGLGRDREGCRRG